MFDFLNISHKFFPLVTLENILQKKKQTCCAISTTFVNRILGKVFTLLTFAYYVFLPKNSVTCWLLSLVMVIMITVNSITFELIVLSIPVRSFKKLILHVSLFLNSFFTIFSCLLNHKMIPKRQGVLAIFISSCNILLTLRIIRTRTEGYYIWIPF